MSALVHNRRNTRQQGNQPVMVFRVGLFLTYLIYKGGIMSSNPLLQLQGLGQSYWYDNISRDLLDSGKMARMIKEDGLRGITSNPSIFYKSIKNSSDYDDQLRQLFRKKDLSDKDIFYELAASDIEAAADLLTPVFEESNGKDGFVSIEVDPSYAYDTEKTIKEAIHLANRIRKKNIMIKVPATKEGLPAVRELVARGLNINVTLLFSVQRYEEVMDAYLGGIDERAHKKLSVDHVASVASFFVSRVDSLTDKLLNEKMGSVAGSDGDGLTGLLGKTAVANARIAFQAYKRTFSSERFRKLDQLGAQKQRLLWASTSTKNPSYNDVLYVDELIGPDTVNTMPTETVNAFRDHGKVSEAIERDIDGAHKIIASLEDAGISLAGVTARLEEDGVKQFKDSFDALLALIREKRNSL